MNEGEAMLKSMNTVDATAIKQLLDQMNSMQEERTTVKGLQPHKISKTLMTSLNTLAQRKLSQPGRIEMPSYLLSAPCSRDR